MVSHVVSARHSPSPPPPMRMPPPPCSSDSGSGVVESGLSLGGCSCEPRGSCGLGSCGPALFFFLPARVALRSGLGRAKRRAVRTWTAEEVPSGVADSADWSVSSGCGDARRRAAVAAEREPFAPRLGRKPLRLLAAVADCNSEPALSGVAVEIITIGAGAPRAVPTSKLNRILRSTL